MVLEPEGYQLDSLDKLEFYPKAFQYLAKIEKNWNTIGNGDQSRRIRNGQFSGIYFWPTQNFILRAFENEGILFDIFVDRSFLKIMPRKPRTGMLMKYIDNPAYDLANSFVLGDRLTDVELAKNLGARQFYKYYNGAGNTEIASKREELDSVITLQSTDWKEIYNF
jgi:imidazoleglycerol-phosphate dehydratase/histidinol-phosphatase